uniref:TF_AP-2 domain-containing protein n=1 Tax=Syphacia muris TaxID=451379 RepID=A0A0N5AAN9_9BILA
MVLSDGDNDFLINDNYFGDSSFLGKVFNLQRACILCLEYETLISVDFDVDSHNNLQDLCFSNEQTTYKETTLNFHSDRSLTCQGMPYVFPFDSNSEKLEALRYDSTSTHSDQFRGKSLVHSLFMKDECSVEEAVDEHESLKYVSKFLPEKVFCTVPSRTAVQKPKLLTVTVGEVHRRVFGPELMNVSLLGSYLRRAKEKDGGKALRDKLFEFGMPVPLGRRKNGNTTTWTCFVEEEAQKMAADLDLALRKFFPVCDFARSIKEKHGVSEMELRSAAFFTRQMLVTMRHILACDQSPVHGREEGVAILNKELQDGCKGKSGIFCKATHGFGSLALTSAIDLFDALMETLMSELDPSSE